MIRRILISLVLIASVNAVSQEFKFGLTAGTHLIHRMKYEQPFLSPDSSFYTYYEASSGNGVVNKWGYVNSFSIGPAVQLSHKRLTLNMEPQFFYQRTVIRFYEPIQTERLLGKKGVRMPIFGTWKLTKKENSMYVLAGLIFHKEAVSDIQNPGFDVFLDGADYNSTVFNLGDGHFYNILYNEKSYWSYTAGIGKIFKGGLNASIRYHSRLNTETRGIRGKVWHLELALNWLFLSSKDFTKKHFLYFD